MLDSNKQQNIGESFGVFSVWGTGGKATQGKGIKAIQFLGASYTREKWGKDGMYSHKQACPQLHIVTVTQGPLGRKLLYQLCVLKYYSLLTVSLFVSGSK